MNMDDTTIASGSAGWDLPTLAHVWDYRTGAIIAGADRLESLSDADRPGSLAALSERVSTLARGLDDGWLVVTAFFLVDDLYKSCFSYSHPFRWSVGVHDYIAATAGVFIHELAQGGFVLHYVIDSTQPEDELDVKLTYVPALFQAAGLFVTGPQLMALELMQQLDDHPRDVTAIPSYRAEGHDMADQLIARCHQERRSSVYLNMDLDDDTPGLYLDVALAPSGEPRTIVVFRNEPPAAGSMANLAAPPEVTLPKTWR